MPSFGTFFNDFLGRSLSQLFIEPHKTKEMFTLKKQGSKSTTPTAALQKGGYLLGYFAVLRLGFYVYSTYLERLGN